MTTYDEIYEVFNTMTWGIDEYSLPKSEQRMYDVIKLGALRYNQRLNLRDTEKIECYNHLESINKDLPSENINLLAHCMRLCILEDMLYELVSMIPVGSKDQALKDYKGATALRAEMVEQEKSEIYNLAIALSDYSDLEEDVDV